MQAHGASSKPDLKQLVLAEARARVSCGARDDARGRRRGVAERLAYFLREGRHGDMAWMETTAERRGHPLAVARGALHRHAGHELRARRRPAGGAGGAAAGAISGYAQSSDYHDVVKAGLKRVAGVLARASGADVKVFVDTAPLMEKPLAQAAGLGWQGKHTNLVSREHGSWLFLGAILTAAELEPDAPEADHCGSCRRCLDVCPTNAFPAPYQLDARRCIAYLTIEHKGHIAARVPRGDGQPRVRLRRLSGRVPVEQVRRRSARDQARGARRDALPPLPSCWRSTMRRSARASPARR